MRALKIVLAIWLLSMLALWIREGRGFCVLDSLPFVERHEYFSSDYEWLALSALLIGLWGCLMLGRKRSAVEKQPGSKFRGEILLVPAAVIGFALISRRVTPAVKFGELVGRSGKPLEHAYLATLCVLVFAAVLAMKWFRKL